MRTRSPIVLAGVLMLLPVGLCSCQKSSATSDGAAAPPAARSTDMPNPSGDAKNPQAGPVANAASTTKPRVRMETSLGPIVIELEPDKAPETVKNFLQYVDDGFYDGTIFHRVISSFMIQGGGFVPGLTEKDTRAEIRNEAKNGLKNKRGTIAMARTGLPHSATSQFFINVKDNAFLNYPGQDGWGYCVFGQVVEGMDTVDKIKAVPTHTVQMTNPVPHDMDDVPVEDVVILSVKRL